MSTAGFDTKAKTNASSNACAVSSYAQWRRFGLAVSVLAVLSGCASISEERCKRGDWEQIGLEDGARGASPSLVREHAEACSKAGVRPDQVRWQAGWDRGIQRFCQPSVGYQEGLSGRQHSGVCHGRGDTDGFVRANLKGYEIYQAENRLRDYESRLSTARSKFDKSKDERERHSLREQMNYLERDIREQRRLISTLRVIGY